ncbi:MAG: RluA family pseudouridine synthase [Oscillospiraceae bacterium]|nr:RluA family pseudouridine synthase [Oscillospiraceae bacterium]
MRLEHVVTAAESGRQIKTILRGAMKVSAALMRRAKTGGRISLNGADVFVTAPAAEGDILVLEVPEEPCSVAPEADEAEIVYSDEWFFALNKPAGQFTHPTGRVNTGTLLNLALSIDPAARAVNRLDRDTSGVVLFARGAWAAALGAKLDFEKEYRALVFGVPQEGEISLPIAREAPHALRRIVSPNGAPSLTRISVLETDGRASLVALRPVTGRTHQLRVHCLAVGCPILGDGLYKTPESAALSRELGITTQALHARSLAFTHPVTGGRVLISAEPEREFFKKYKL